MILHVIEDLRPESGGPPAVVIELVRHQSRHGRTVAVACRQGPRDEAERERLERVFMDSGVRYLDLSRGQGTLRQRLAAAIKSLRPTVMHLHGVWGADVRHAATLARRLRIPYVVSSHGMLHPYALAQRAWKKRMYLAVFPGILGAAGEILALNREECEHVEARLRLRASVLPNGIDASEYAGADPDMFRRAHPRLGSAPFVLFIGRLHPIKGVDLLVRSYAIARGHGLQHELVIVGPEDGGGDAARRAAAETGVDTHVHFVGPAFGAMKRSALAACSALVHRPRFEGFGLAVVEGLAAGRPVVTTAICRLDGAAESGAIVCAPDADEGFARELTAILADRTRAAAVAARGREWVCREFDWARIVERAEAVYARVGAPQA